VLSLRTIKNLLLDQYGTFNGYFQVVLKVLYRAHVIEDLHTDEVLKIKNFDEKTPQLTVHHQVKTSPMLFITGPRQGGNPEGPTKKMEHGFSLSSANFLKGLLAK
jgi:hypothetical protein